jgi:hypothetical protein
VVRASGARGCEAADRPAGQPPSKVAIAVGDGAEPVRAQAVAAASTRVRTPSVAMRLLPYTLAVLG